jgi:hypothetical protein
MISTVINFFVASKDQGAVTCGPKISIVVIVYNMAVQAENTIKSMLRDYQLEVPSQAQRFVVYSAQMAMQSGELE